MIKGNVSEPKVAVVLCCAFFIVFLFRVYGWVFLCHILILSATFIKYILHCKMKCNNLCKHFQNCGLLLAMMIHILDCIFDSTILILFNYTLKALIRQSHVHYFVFLAEISKLTYFWLATTCLMHHSINYFFLTF